MNDKLAETERPMFADARVGDRVWSIQYGWGEVVEIDTGTEPVVVSHQRLDFIICYDFSGRPNDNSNVVLFWDEVKIVPPPRPKRKVTKTLEGWVALTAKENHGMFSTSVGDIDILIAQGRAKHSVYVTGPYEVEE